MRQVHHVPANVDRQDPRSPGTLNGAPSLETENDENGETVKFYDRFDEGLYPTLVAISLTPALWRDAGAARSGGGAFEA